jgi:scpA/B protein
VVRFLALLELYKEGALHVEQDAPLGAIRVRASASAAQFVIREETADTAGTQDAHETSEAPESSQVNESEANTEQVEEDYE